ncbi:MULTISPECIES: hypothetical protein [unclassified Bradyrhizobium]|uniref:hypothetical protein n=1 Tax=unclassified Bradyrhizobium TaxID=2631580 RepID=UPI002915E5A2|nr:MULTISPECIES: hypothetical protein [unclassified Bradyrhizobium]
MIIDNHAEERRDAALDAMEHHQRNITYPILYDLGDRLCVLGSGALFAYENRHFVITAAHLFDDDENIGKIVPENLAGPNTRNHGTPTTFGPIELYRGDQTPYDFDIAAIELRDAHKVVTIKRNWRFLGVSDIAMPSDQPLFCLGGYPRDLQAQRGRTTRADVCCANLGISERPRERERACRPNI